MPYIRLEDGSSAGNVSFDRGLSQQYLRGAVGSCADDVGTEGPLKAHLPLGIAGHDDLAAHAKVANLHDKAMPCATFMSLFLECLLLQLNVVVATIPLRFEGGGAGAGEGCRAPLLLLTGGLQIQ